MIEIVMVYYLYWLKNEVNCSQLEVDFEVEFEVEIE